MALVIGALLLLPAMASAVGTGSIKGTVIDASSKVGIEGVEVCAYEAPEYVFAGCEETDAAGEYTLSGLATGSYRVEFWGASGSLNYLTQYYSGKSSFSQATAVSVVAPAATTNINAEMHPGGQIKGNVTDASTHVGIKELVVCAFEVSGSEFALCAQTEPSGAYTISGLPAGSYKVEFIGISSGLNYLTQYYNNKTSYAQATAVAVVTGSAVSNINAEMHPGGTIKGSVTDAVSHAGIKNIEVCAFTIEIFGGCAYTNSSGEYSIMGLPTATYIVEFWDEESIYKTQYYNGKSSPGQATQVPVTAPAMVSGIDAQLVKALIPTVPPIVTAPVSVPPAVFSPPRTVHCRKGFRAVKKHGKKVCAKIKRHRVKHRR